LILLLIFVLRTSASNCLEDRLRNGLKCVEWDVKPYSLTRLRTGKPSLYITSHPGQLSLSSLRGGKLSTGLPGWG